MTPMELQYLVGLCSLRRNPDAVEIIIGDMVLDEAAEKPRDVDITVKVAADDGTITAFKGIEVKQEARPLDVAVIEQLALKLKDMSEVTHRAVVSASGYTSGAVSKAASHGVELYQFDDWSGPIEKTLPHWKNPLPPQLALKADQWLLYWDDVQLDVVVPSGPSRFAFGPDTELLDVDGKKYPGFQRFKEYQDAVLLRSTQILWRLPPAASFLGLPPAEIDQEKQFARTMKWPHTHTLDVGSDGIHLALEGQVHLITQITIFGRMYWQSVYQLPEYKVLRRLNDGEVFASAMVAPGRTKDELVCFVFDPTSSVSGVHFVHLTEKQQRLLHRLELLVRPPRKVEAQ